MPPVEREKDRSGEEELAKAVGLQTEETATEQWVACVASLCTMEIVLFPGLLTPG